MKRRTFLQTGTWSMAGVALPSPIIVQGLLSSKGRARDWFAAWIKAIDANRRSYIFQQPEALRPVLEQVNAAMEKHGFLPIDKGLYFTSTGDFCCYPLIRKNPMAGLEELLVPVLRRNETGAWQTMSTLTGYQLEAMSHAAAEFQVNAENLQEWLLPLSPAQQDQTFCTRRGALRIETWVGRNGIATHIQIKEGNRLQYDKRFDSKLG